MELTLSDGERELLLRLLDQAMGDLRVEVRRTSTPAYHDDLQAEEKVLQGLLERLRSG